LKIIFIRCINPEQHKHNICVAKK